jgi:hypothetical protein
MTDDWKVPLANYASKAGFAEATIEPLLGAPDLSTEARLWRSSYAQFLVLPIKSMTEAALRAAAEVGQEWLDLSCMAEERTDHRVMDAYLLIVSDDPLPDALFAAVQEIELDPTSCRKHVAWPCDDGEEEEIIWRRLLRVTALGLPTSPAAHGMTNTPLLKTEFHRRLLKDVKDLKGKPAARQHAEHPLMDDTQ